METLSYCSPPKSPFVSLNANMMSNPEFKFLPTSCHSLPPNKTSIHQISTKRNLPNFQKLILKPMDYIKTRFNNNSPIPSFIDPKQVLSGNFSPIIDELPPTPCPVLQGSLPPSLNGVYIQNGPNPQFIPRRPYHMVDGDGMLHSVSISGGRATYCRRYVRTYKFLIERALGFPIFHNAFADLNSFTASSLRTLALVLTGQFIPLKIGLGTANTSFALIGKSLVAVKITPDGDIKTIGRCDLHERNPNFLNMTAHPKIDPKTGEAFAFRYLIIPPFLTFFRIDSTGRKQKDVPINSLKIASFIHDFAVTESYAVFPDPQIVFDVREVTRGRSVMSVDLEKVPRLGVIPKYAEDDSKMFWIEVPGLNIVHFFNAWEEDGGAAVVILASNLLPIEYALKKMDSVHLSIEKIRIDVKRKKVAAREVVSRHSLDFASINREYAGKENRYLFAAAMENMPKMSGVVKVDLAASGGECVVASRMYGPGCYGSEPIFVAKSPAAAEEDDGYLLAYVHNEKNEESELLGMDAKSRDLETVAAGEGAPWLPFYFGLSQRQTFNVSDLSSIIFSEKGTFYNYFWGNNHIAQI